MPVINKQQQAKGVWLLADALDIPESYYELARARYESIGRWLNRAESVIATYGPTVYPQGSFSHGTVKLAGGAYDLDVVCELTLLTKDMHSQEWLKREIGKEITAYAKEHRMKAAPEPTGRCWHLEYAEKDGLQFHIDILPAVSEDVAVKRLLVGHVPAELAEMAIAITDQDHPAYREVSHNWPQSNPRGFARWFEDKARGSMRRIEKQLEQFPPHRWNTPLQQAVRILKDHRDTMFQDLPKRKPASIIVTTLAAMVFEDQMSTAETLNAFVECAPEIIDRGEVSNPTNPTVDGSDQGENFAEKWRDNPDLAMAFTQWLVQLERDLHGMGFEQTAAALKAKFANSFGVVVEEAVVKSIIGAAAPVVARTKVETRSAPWGGV